MKNNYKVQLSIGFVCVVLGLMLSIQFKTVNANVGTVNEYRARELAIQLRKVREERDNLLKLKEENEKKLRDYENIESQGSTAAKIIRGELDKARIIAGLVDVEGPGITVVVDDLKWSEKYNYNLIDYTMILEIVNELNAAGAEAISINNQRIIATTEIRQAGMHININTKAFAPPFTFMIIGNPNTLEAALRLRGGIVDKLETNGIHFSITQSQSVKIVKYDGVIEKKYSKVVEEDGTN